VQEEHSLSERALMQWRSWDVTNVPAAAQSQRLLRAMERFPSSDCLLWIPRSTLLPECKTNINTVVQTCIRLCLLQKNKETNE